MSPPNDTDRAMHALATRVGDAVRAMFTAYGIELEDAGPDDALPALTPDDLVATVPFGSATVRGTLMLLAPASAVARTMPVLPAPGAEAAAARDWLGELANQALGRVRERVAWPGGELLVGAPVVRTLAEVPFGEVDPTRTAGARLVAPEAHVVAWCELAALDGVVFTEVPRSRAGTRIL
jgi:hypothetical protein